jgi:hypothetical protein
MRTPTVGRLRFLNPRHVQSAGATLTDVDIRSPVSNDTIDNSRWISSRTKAAAASLIVVLTSYATYNAAVDIVLKKAKRPDLTPPVAEFVQAQKAPLISVLTDYPIADIFVRDRPKDVYEQPTFEQPRKASLVSVLTSYASYNAAPDIVLRDRRNKDVDPPFQHITQQRPGILSPTFYPYVPALDIAQLDDRRSKAVDPPFEYLKAQNAALVIGLTQ